MADASRFRELSLNMRQNVAVEAEPPLKLRLANYALALAQLAEKVDREEKRKAAFDQKHLLDRTARTQRTPEVAFVVPSRITVVVGGAPVKRSHQSPSTRWTEDRLRANAFFGGNSLGVVVSKHNVGGKPRERREPKLNGRGQLQYQQQLYR
jgi:hypothetical protein